MTRKVWKKPKLVVLFRGRPEEAVLQGCKSPSAGGQYAARCTIGGGWAQCNAVSPT
jgi:hypothetical protein